MADFAYASKFVVESAEAPAASRHSAMVRVTHWVFSLGFFGLAISGFGILLSHPHFYWGETGGIGTPPLFSLPLPTMLGGPSGWGRSLHFLSAWIAVLTGSLYAISGVFTRHFREHLLPAPADLSWRSLRASLLDHARLRRPAEEGSYNV